jgi:hypothetical protein
MKSAFQHDADGGLETLFDAADRAEAVRLWREQNRLADAGRADSESFAVLVEKLGAIFEFVAASTSPAGMAMRVWAMLYAVRPDLVRHETIQQAADRFGVSQQRLCQQLDAFKRRTGFTYVSRVGLCDPESAKARIEAMTRGRAEKARRFRERIAA